MVKVSYTVKEPYTTTETYYEKKANKIGQNRAKKFL